jgi:dienelactone hydrolase
MKLITEVTAAGTAFVMLPTHDAAPAPTLLLLASTGVVTLTIEPYCRVGHLLHECGWNVVSLDLPCHGADRRRGEPAQLDGWAARTARGVDFVEAFRARANDVLAQLISARVTDPHLIAAAGTSRGGFMAFQAAAGNPSLRAVAAFAPVTDLLALREFAGQGGSPLVRRLALMEAVEALAGRAAWVTIGHADERVDTGKAVDFAAALTAASRARHLASEVTLRVLPVPGHNSLAEWHDAAATWLRQTVLSTVRTPSPAEPQMIARPGAP